MSKVYENDEIREGTTEETRTVKTNLGGVEPLEKAKQSDSVCSVEVSDTKRIEKAATEETVMSAKSIPLTSIPETEGSLTAFANIKATEKPEVFDYIGLKIFFHSSNTTLGYVIVKQFPSTITAPSGTVGVSASLVVGHPALDSIYNETFNVALELFKNTKNIVLEER